MTLAVRCQLFGKKYPHFWPGAIQLRREMCLEIWKAAGKHQLLTVALSAAELSPHCFEASINHLLAQWYYNNKTVRFLTVLGVFFFHRKIKSHRLTQNCKLLLYTCICVNSLFSRINSIHCSSATVKVSWNTYSCKASSPWLVYWKKISDVSK